MRVQLDPIVERIRAHFSAKHLARDRAYQASRETIRNCANAIRAVHRAEFSEAQTLLKAARDLLSRTKRDLAEHPDVFHGGFVDDAQKEYAEGCITYALVAGEALPTPEALDVGYAPYLNGMGEAAGELRRYLLDMLRRNEVARCEDVLSQMDDIYTVLVTMDFPDAVTNGLRRTTDMVRGVLERTRGDLTVAVRQRDLEEKLAVVERRLSAAPRPGNPIP
ncbi:MAG: haloacid dehalogenase [Dehalococcoidia bacterium]|nr:haloacid dehalogenase [Dehalococcoidia bacterium]